MMILSSRWLTRLSNLSVLLVCFMNVKGTHQLSSSTPAPGSIVVVTERRQSTLLPWVDSKDHSGLGWALEERIYKKTIMNDDNDNKTNLNGIYRVRVGWGADPKDDFSTSPLCTTVQLPFFGRGESLGSSLWPSAVAGAILCQSPTVQEKLLLSAHNIMELGCGLGLKGLVAAATAGKAKPTNCLLTDNDEVVLEQIQQLIEENSISSNDNNNTNTNIRVSRLDWRDEISFSDDEEKPDLVLAADVAYYYFLIRPFLDTAKAYLTNNNAAATLFMTGQANRESLWDLYNCIANGCYNQLTDEKDDPWTGLKAMYLYKLKMSDWKVTTTTTTTTTSDDEDNDNTTFESTTSVETTKAGDNAGTLNIASIIYQTEGVAPENQITTLSGDSDYLASEKDKRELYLD